MVDVCIDQSGALERLLFWERNSYENKEIYMDIKNCYNAVFNFCDWNWILSIYI